MTPFLPNSVTASTLLQIDFRFMSQNTFLICVLTLPGPGGPNRPPLVLVTCCALKIADMSSKLLDNWFFIFLEKKPLKYYFKIDWRFFWGFFEVLHISVGQKIKILENRPGFLKFSAKTHCCFWNRQILSYRKVIYLKKILRG